MPSPTHPDVIIMLTCELLASSPILLGEVLADFAAPMLVPWAIVVATDPGLIEVILLGAAELLLGGGNEGGFVFIVVAVVPGLELVVVKD